jgi:hypothetical protein
VANWHADVDLSSQLARENLKIKPVFERSKLIGRKRQGKSPADWFTKFVSQLPISLSISQAPRTTFIIVALSWRTHRAIFPFRVSPQNREYSQNVPYWFEDFEGLRPIRTEKLNPGEVLDVGNLTYEMQRVPKSNAGMPRNRQR